MTEGHTHFTNFAATNGKLRLYVTPTVFVAFVQFLNTGANIMPSCTGHRIRVNAWAQNGTTEVGRAANVHAEIGQYNEIALDYDDVLLVQDAFPCTNCHLFFLDKSTAKKIVIKIERDDGNYSRDHANIAPITLPMMIYYANSLATYIYPHTRDSKKNVPGFQHFPDFSGLSYY